MNVKQIKAKLEELDFAGNGGTVIEIVTNSGAIKMIKDIRWSAQTGAIQIWVK